MRASRIFQIVLFLVFLSAAQNAAAQILSPDDAGLREIAEKARRDREFERLKNIPTSELKKAPKNVAAKPKATEKDLEAVAVDAEDKAKYAAFLKQPRTGIFRLHDVSNCELSRKVYNVEEPCPAHIPEKGSAYSFQEDDYETRWLADISLEEAAFRIRKIQTLSFLTDLGNVPIENLTLAAEGIRQMTEFVPSADKKEVFAQAKIASRGFQIGKYVYKTSRPLKENFTYALRSITYRFENPNVAVKARRLDVIIIFRVVRTHPDGSVNILWKELQRKDAPKFIDKRSLAQYKY